MHPRLEELTALLDRARDELLRTVHDVPDDLRERRPPDGGWSVAEVLEHLRVVEAGSAALLARRTLRAREAGVGPDPETSSVLGRLDDAGLLEPTVRRVAPEMVQPRADATVREALAGLDASRASLGDAIRALDGIDASRVMLRHAALGELDGTRARSTRSAPHSARADAPARGRRDVPTTGQQTFPLTW
jgi:hypothetical protein